MRPKTESPLFPPEEECTSKAGLPTSWQSCTAADISCLPGLHARLSETLACYACPARVTNHLLLALEEAFVNIVDYAYPDGQGEVIIQCHVQVLPIVLPSKDGLSPEDAENEIKVILCLRDTGRPFNPLEQASPDLMLPPQARKIGGLGIPLLHKVVDTLDYVRHGDENILTMTKLWRILAPGTTAKQKEKKNDH